MTDDSLLKQFRRQQTPQIATEEVEEKFAGKMRDIQLAAKEKETEAKAEELGIPFMNLAKFPISSETLVTFSEEESLRLGAICFFRGASSLRIGAQDPANPELQARLAQLESELYVKPLVHLISQHSFDSAYRLYQAVPKIRKFVSGVQITEEEIRRYEKEISTFQELN